MQFALALELSHRWGILDSSSDSQEALEARLASARAAKRERHISFDDLAQSGGFRLATLTSIFAPSLLVDTPSSLAEAIATLIVAPDDEHHSMSKIVVGLDVEWASQLHSRSRKKRARLGSAIESCNNDGNDDSEAKPTAALLQLASRHDIFLVDVATLSATSSGREALSVSLGSLLGDVNVIKLGFGVSQDLTVLARAINPALPSQAFCASPPRSMVDLKGEGVGVSSLLKGRGLSEYAMEFLGKPLDKAEQCSNWSIRPLRQSQLEYAALDAWVLVAIWEHMQIRKADAIRA